MQKSLDCNLHHLHFSIMLIAFVVTPSCLAISTKTILCILKANFLASCFLSKSNNLLLLPEFGTGIRGIRCPISTKAYSNEAVNIDLMKL